MLIEFLYSFNKILFLFNNISLYVRRGKKRKLWFLKDKAETLRRETFASRHCTYSHLKCVFEVSKNKETVKLNI